MQKQDILELKKRYKKDECTFTKVCGCYVNSEKHKVLQFRESFLNLEEDDAFKYMDIVRKVFSGTVDNHLLELQFPLDENLENPKQTFFYQLKKSQLRDDELLDSLYQSIIDEFPHEGNYLILLFHDAYDVITKTSDRSKLDESEEVYEYILCAICPVSLSKPGLRYFEEEQKIKARIRDWIVEKPTIGFVFPAFINRSADVNAIMYYTKNPKNPHLSMMEEVLGCTPKQTAAIQKESFQMIVKDSMGPNEEIGENALLEIHSALEHMVEEHETLFDGGKEEPLRLSNKEIKQLLIDSDIPEDVIPKIETSYQQCFEEDFPIAQNLIDSKITKATEQREKELKLQKQVVVLQEKLESTIPQSNEEDVVLHVNPEKASAITSQEINGQRCLVIPLDENENAIINGQEHSF
ncbi:protein of unknown function [Tindallia magadiensis]|uniref:DUF4317 domain-containing protein n=1 Tax=Tindallia magadiensis TaxID=69895 RepID=A0A1I3FFC4_9FIRM|nr:DUF4317 domain-containing protein [Tindallia magadiensis]SFI09792.1 protein of unknown function [Tindallia magadiensis]